MIAVVSDEARAEFCRGLGANETINYRDGDLAVRLRQMTDGRGVDAVYDPAGGSGRGGGDSSGSSRSATGRRIRGGAWPRIETPNLVVTNTSLVGVFAGGYGRGELDAIHSELSSLVSSGGLQNAVTTKVPFVDLPSALQRLADRTVIGKMVMVL